MNIGIVCYASVGGSGIVATELGKALARRGHQVHFISTETPFRLGEFRPALRFTRCSLPRIRFREPQYLLSLSNRVVQVAREFRLDIIHAHYAVPHATAAFLSRQCWRRPTAAPLRASSRHCMARTSRLSATIPHSQIVAFSIDQSDRVTAVSESLREATYSELQVRSNIVVIPNFLDCSIHRRLEVPDLRQRFTGGDSSVKIVTHVSNFRPVKRIEAVLQIFDRIRRAVPARLLLVGDGPELGKASRLGRELGSRTFSTSSARRKRLCRCCR